MVSKCGDEIFFEIKDVQVISANLTRQVSVGDVAFSLEASCLCVFLGPTTASVLENPVSENPVVVIGWVIAPLEKLRGIKLGEKVKMIVFEEKPKVFHKDTGCEERKLSQSEIDVLVKKLLEEKNKARQQ